MFIEALKMNIEGSYPYVQSFSTLVVSGSLAVSLLGVTSVKTLANPIEPTPCPCADLDCVTTVQDGNCTVVTRYWRGRVISTRRYCPVNNGSGNTNTNGGGGNNETPTNLPTNPRINNK